MAIAVFIGLVAGVACIAKCLPWARSYQVHGADENLLETLQVVLKYSAS